MMCWAYGSEGGVTVWASCCECLVKYWCQALWTESGGLNGAGSTRLCAVVGFGTGLNRVARVCRMVSREVGRCFVGMIWIGMTVGVVAGVGEICFPGSLET